MSEHTLTHLKQLEAESIHIIREVAAEFERPGDDVLDREGFFRHAASGPEGVFSPVSCPSLCCTSIPPGNSGK